MPAKPLDVLIAAAHASELEGLHAALGPSLAGRVHGLRVAAAEIGVGIPAAAVGTARVVAGSRPRACILLGSCGVYPGPRRAALLAPAIPDAMQLTDAGVAARQAAYPEAMPISASAHPRLAAGLRRVARAAVGGAVATTPGITCSDALARRLARRSRCETENLEAVAAGLACTSLAVPFAAVLVITNVVGALGRKQWAQNRRAAAAAGAELVLAWLARGAPGLPER